MILHEWIEQELSKIEDISNRCLYGPAWDNGVLIDCVKNFPVLISKLKEAMVEIGRLTKLNNDSVTEFCDKVRENDEIIQTQTCAILEKDSEIERLKIIGGQHVFAHAIRLNDECGKTNKLLKERSLLLGIKQAAQNVGMNWKLGAPYGQDAIDKALADYEKEFGDSNG